MSTRQTQYDVGGGKISKISVDNFSGRADVFFLTHIHSDHTQGLVEGWNSIDHGRGNGAAKIYCSEVTRELLALGAWSSTPFMDHVVSVEDDDEPFQIDLGTLGTLLVTTVDANHCAGSVMFIINNESRSNALLLTGDFRPDPRIHTESIMEFFRDQRIKKAIVDTTLADPTWSDENFPTQAQSVENALVQIQKTQKKYTSIVYICLMGFGQENFLKLLHKMTGMRIFFDLREPMEKKMAEMWKFYVYKLNCLDGAITTNPREETRFRACPAWVSRAGIKRGPIRQDFFCARRIRNSWEEGIAEKGWKPEDAPIFVRPSTLAFADIKSATKRSKVDTHVSAADEEEQKYKKITRRRSKRTSYLERRDRTYWTHTQCIRVLYSMHVTRSELKNFIHDITPPGRHFPVIVNGEDFKETMYNPELEDAWLHGGMAQGQDASAGSNGRDADSPEANLSEKECCSEDSGSELDHSTARVFVTPPPAEYATGFEPEVVIPESPCPSSATKVTQQSSSRTKVTKRQRAPGPKSPGSPQPEKQLRRVKHRRRDLSAFFGS